MVKLNLLIAGTLIVGGILWENGSLLVAAE
jgi:hypothetical protein